MASRGRGTAATSTTVAGALGMERAKGGYGEKEQGYFVRSSWAQRVGGLLVLLSVALLVVGLTSSIKIDEQQEEIEQQEATLHKGMMRSLTSEKRNHAKLVQTLSMMQAHLVHEGVKERKLKRAVRRFTEQQKAFTTRIAGLVAKIEEATANSAVPPAVNSLRKDLDLLYNDHRHATQQIERTQNWALQHDSNRAGRLKQLHSGIQEMLRDIIAEERATELREAVHAAVDADFAQDLAKLSHSNGAQLESREQAAVGRVIYRFNAYLKHLPRIDVPTGVLAQAQRLLSDIHNNVVPIAEAEDNVQEMSEHEAIATLMKPWSSHDPRTLIERFEYAVRVASFLPKRALVEGQLARWSKHELSDPEMMLALQTHAGKLLPLVLGVGDDVQTGWSGDGSNVLGGGAGVHKRFERRPKGLHLNARRAKMRSKTLELRKRIEQCLALEKERRGGVFSEQQQSMCDPVGVSSPLSSSVRDSMESCLSLTDPSRVVARGGIGHEWSSEERARCKAFGLGPKGAEELAWCLSIERDASTEWTADFRKVCARYAIGVSFSNEELEHDYF